MFHPGPSPHITTLLSQNQVVPEAPLRGVPSFLPGKATLNLLLLAQFAVQAHLLVEIGIELPAPKQHQEPSANFS
jgi:hypothetical protein